MVQLTDGLRKKLKRGQKSMAEHDCISVYEMEIGRSYYLSLNDSSDTLKSLDVTRPVLLNRRYGWQSELIRVSANKVIIWRDERTSFEVGLSLDRSLWMNLDERVLDLRARWIPCKPETQGSY